MPKFQCRYCGNLYLTTKGLKEHIKNKHPREKQLEAQVETYQDFAETLL
ncbi:hypothetical protein ES703_46550 [subsurface metagenome]